MQEKRGRAGEAPLLPAAIDEATIRAAAAEAADVEMEAAAVELTGLLCWLGFLWFIGCVGIHKGAPWGGGGGVVVSIGGKVAYTPGSGLEFTLAGRGAMCKTSSRWGPGAPWALLGLIPLAGFPEEDAATQLACGIVGGYRCCGAVVTTILPGSMDVP